MICFKVICKLILVVPANFINNQFGNNELGTNHSFSQNLSLLYTVLVCHFLIMLIILQFTDNYTKCPYVYFLIKYDSNLICLLYVTFIDKVPNND